MTSAEVKTDKAISNSGPVGFDAWQIGDTVQMKNGLGPKMLITSVNKGEAYSRDRLYDRFDNKAIVMSVELVWHVEGATVQSNPYLIDGLLRSSLPPACLVNISFKLRLDEAKLKSEIAKDALSSALAEAERVIAARTPQTVAGAWKPSLDNPTPPKAKRKPRAKK